MSYETLTLEQDGQMAVLTLSRPEKRNAISAQMITDLLGALDHIEASPARVVILTGSGKAFCAGMDLEGLRAIARQSAGEHLEDSRRMAKMFHRIYSFPKAIICAVNGAAIAGGCGIATLGDFTLAVPEAKFGYTEVRIGFVPAIVSTFLLRQVGEKSARELLLTGKIISAEEAHRLGMVNEIVAPELLLARARELADQLLENSPVSIAATKRLLAEYVRGERDAQIRTAVRENARIRESQDFREGVSSFLEKRKPRWSGK